MLYYGCNLRDSAFRTRFELRSKPSEVENTEFELHVRFGNLPNANTELKVLNSVRRFERGAKPNLLYTTTGSQRL